MHWIQLRLDTRPDAVAELEDHLLARGALAVTLEDNSNQPVLEPGVGETPLWQNTRLTALFTAETDANRIAANLPTDLLAPGSERHIEILEDKDWTREWMQHYQPLCFGGRLWVSPSWTEQPEAARSARQVTLLLDPGLAFGTGTHPTTALCLEALAQMALADTHIVDYGCGSGILAIAALKLGAARALGVDNDPQAISASRENATRNDIPTAQLALQLSEKEIDSAWMQRADVVVANILAGPLAELAPTLLQLLKPGGTLLLSGLLEEQAQTLCAHYTPHITLEVAQERDGWVCLQGTRKR